MSKTKRRTNRQVPKYITHDWENYLTGYGSIKEGKDLKKAIAIWYSDSNYKTGNYNQHTDSLHRAEAKEELVRFKKNPDYEVQIRRKRYRDWY